jgi:hypothetical protein
LIDLMELMLNRHESISNCIIARTYNESLTTTHGYVNIINATLK